MRLKAVPPAPDSLAALERAQAAVPLVPEPEESCCVRLADRLEGVNKDDARSWLAFLEVLGLAEEGELGYVRTRTAVDTDDLGGVFIEGVYGVEELLDRLERGGPTAPEALFEGYRDLVPQWERHRNPGTWETVWRDRLDDVLGWAALFGVVEPVDGRYRSASG